MMRSCCFGFLASGMERLQNSLGLHFSFDGFLDLLKQKKKSLKISGVATQKQKDDDDLVKVKCCIEVIYDIFSLYGYTTPDEDICLKHRQDKERLVERYYDYIKLAGFGSWKDLFKYKINAFFSYVMEQEIPSSPKFLEEFVDLLDPSFLGFGRAKRFLFRLSQNRERLVSFAQTLAQGKKGAPAVHKDKVLEACVATVEHLTTIPVQIPDFIIDEDGWEPVTVSRNSMEFQLRRSMREVYGKSVLTREEVRKPFFPSTSSQYNYSRKEMGAVGAFYDAFPELLGKHESLIDKALTNVCLFDRLPECFGEMGQKEMLEILEEAESGRSLVKETIGFSYDCSRLYEQWNILYEKLFLKALEERPIAKAIGLPEPLKVRVITAGPPLTYSILKPIQKFLWRTIKNISVFELVGKPISAEFIERKIGYLEPGQVYVSGDYKASTDNLHSWVSNCLCDEFIAILRETSSDLGDLFIDQLATLMRRALTGHLLEHPISGELLEQREGQLMGSIISFPFLCMANAAMCRWALEISEGKKYKITDRNIYDHDTIPLGINGDDCVFKGTEGRIFEIWKKVTAFGGLESSVGKTFVSNKFLTMNSVQFKVNSWEMAEQNHDCVGVFEEKYVNMALVYGQEKSGVRDKLAFTLGALHSELQKSCPEDLFVGASDLFIDNHENELRKYDVPWFIPQWLGGHGLIPYKSRKYALGELKKHTRRKLRAVCTMIRHNMGQAGGEDKKPRNIKMGQKWQMHKLYGRELRDLKWLGNQFFETLSRGCVFKHTNLEESNQQLYTAEIINLLFTKQGEKDLCPLNLKADPHKELADSYFHNEKVWRATQNRLYTEDGSPRDTVAMKTLSSEYLMTEAELVSERREGFFPCFPI